MISIKSITGVVIQNISAVILGLLTTYLLAIPIGTLYCGRLGICSAGIASIDTTGLMGLLLGYFMFVPFFLGLFDTAAGKWLAGGLVLLPVIFMLLIEIPLSHLLPFLVAGVVGYTAGAFGNKALWTLAPGMMAKLGA